VKLPRDLSGIDLAQRLLGLGYTVSRQTGSHLRLTKHTEKGEHHLTIPSHRVLKVGTLNSILNEIAQYHEISKGELLTQLFG
jgi:predicted RNA binding protein YcfA (HicA-like mRNA interferase family)